MHNPTSRMCQSWFSLFFCSVNLVEKLFFFNLGLSPVVPANHGNKLESGSS